MRRAGFHAMLLLLVLAAFPARAEEQGSTLYERANEAYFAGRYDEAATAYGQLLNEHGDVPALHFNRGNAMFALERYGEATWHFAMAQRLADGELQARAEVNRETTRTALLEKYRKKLDKGILRYDESHGVWHALFSLVSPTLGLFLFLLFAGPLLGGLVIWLFARRPGFRTLGKVTVLSLLLPVLLAAFFYGGRSWQDEHVKLGIVISDEAILHDAPDAAAPGDPIAEGLEVRVLLHNEQGFTKVARFDGVTGYLPDAQVRELP